MRRSPCSGGYDLSLDRLCDAHRAPLQQSKRRFAHIARAVFEAREFLQECQLYLAHRAVALLRDDQLRFARFFSARVLIFLVDFRPNE